MQYDVKKACAVLETDRGIVGVKLVRTREAYDFYKARDIAKPLAYCVCVKSAMHGAALKFTARTSGCMGSTRALGLEKPGDDFLDGSEGVMLGLFAEKALAGDVARKMAINANPVYGAIVKPLERFETAPDVVLVVTDTRNLMRLIQGYTYTYGLQAHFNMTGNQAVCVESTVYPLQTGRINVSMFCSGTRYLAKWKNSEAMAGIPFDKFAGVIEGVRQTVNAVEMNDRKRVIDANLRNAGVCDMPIIYDRTYYTDLEKQKTEKRKSERIAAQNRQQ
jgi:uncharacterized protein (DUF169 family)